MMIFKKHISKVICLFCLLFIAGCVLQPSVTVSMLPAYDALFENREGWTGADGAYSLVLTKEKILCTSTPGNIRPLAFSGIHLISPELFESLHKKGKFSIIPAYLELAHEKLIKGYEHDPDNWFDLGSVKNIEKAEAYLTRKQ